MTQLSPKSSFLKVKTSLSTSECEIIRAILESEKIKIQQDALSKQAHIIIQSILEQNGLGHISSQIVYHQIQLITSPSRLLMKDIKFSLQGEPKESYPLHEAARKGDLIQVKKLVSSGYQVNATDIFGSTPLHMAAMYGHKEVAAYLIRKGADINASTYEEYYFSPFSTYSSYHTFTPLDLAVKYAPETATLTLLLQKGAEPDHWGMLMETNLNMVKEALDNHNYTQLDLAMSKYEAIAKYTFQGLWIDEGYGTEKLPLAVLLLDIAAACPDVKFYDRINQTINNLNSIDTLGIAEGYIAAKNLTHAFPSENIYDIKIGPFLSDFYAEGYDLVCPVNAAAYSLDGFTKTIADPFKISVFKEATEIFKQASFSVSQGALYETSEKIYDSYLAGQTILLPTSWFGHAIDVILDKNLNLFIMANGGQSYPGLSSGLNAYHMSNPISIEDIYRILNNEDQMSLEFKLFYDLGLKPAKDYSIFSEGQIFGNCAWFSQQLAQKGLLFLEVNKHLDNIDVSKNFAQNWFEEWNNFHQTAMLKEYLNHPSLEVGALGDILIHYHAHLFTPEEKERAELIVNMITSKPYKKEFDGYYQYHQAEFSPELNQLLKDHGYQYKTSLGSENSHDPVEIKSSQESEIKLKEILQFEDKQDPLAELGGSHLPSIHPSLPFVVIDESAQATIQTHSPFHSSLQIENHECIF